MQQQEHPLKLGDMQRLLKDVYQVHLQFVNELEQVKKRCSKLEKANNMLLSKNQELQSANSALNVEHLSLLNEVTVLKTRLTLPCKECQLLREQMNLMQTTLNREQLEQDVSVNKEDRAELLSCRGPQKDAVAIIIEADLPPLACNSSNKFEAVNESQPKNNFCNHTSSPKNIQTSIDRFVNKFVPHIPRMESSDTDDDKPGRFSDETAATARKEPTSEERAKSLKLMRKDQRVKCRYTEKPVVDMCKVGLSSDSSSNVFQTYQLNKVGPPQLLFDPYVDCETSQSASKTKTRVPNGQKTEAAVKRPNIIVPESMPIDFDENERDSFSCDVSVVNNQNICDIGIQKSDDIEQGDQHMSLKLVRELSAPDSPVFNRGQQLIVTSVNSSPSLFDDEDERSSARKQRLLQWPSLSKLPSSQMMCFHSPKLAESPSLVKRDTIRSPAIVRHEGSSRSQCVDMEGKLLNETVMSPQSPSLLSQKLTFNDDFKLAVDPVSETAVRQWVGNEKLELISENDLCSHSELKSTCQVCRPSGISCKLISASSIPSCSDISCVTTSFGGVDEALSYGTCERDPDETVCPFQTSYVNCDESLSVSSLINLPVGDSPQEMCDLSYSDNVLASLASLQTLNVNEPNGSLAVGVSLSEYMNNTGNTHNSLTESVVSVHPNQSEMKNRLMTRSQSQRPVKRQRLGDGTTSHIPSAVPVSDPSSVLNLVDYRLLQDIGNVQENPKRLDNVDVEASCGIDTEVDPDDSFDRAPKVADVNYKYVEVVRKQHLRRQMDAFACLQCQQWFNGLNLSKEELAERMKHCRHKATSEPTSTPDHFWSIGFPTTQQGLEKGYLGETSSKPSEFRRKKGLRKLFQSNQVNDDCNTK